MDASFIPVIITNCIIIAVLYHASWEDIRRRDIGSLHVIILFITVAIYSVITGHMGLQTTYVFIFTFILFMGISVFSRGHFGIGDSLVISALAWLYGDFTSLQHFLYALGIVMIPWSAFWLILHRKDNNLKSIMKGFKQTLPIDELRPGMVLATDNFMHGLTINDIEKLRHEGYITITVKNPMPFIPCIFIAFLIVLII